MVPDPEKDLGKDHHPLFKVEHRKSLQGEETLDLHPMLETDPGLHPLLEEDTQNPFGKDR